MAYEREHHGDPYMTFGEAMQAEHGGHGGPAPGGRKLSPVGATLAPDSSQNGGQVVRRVPAVLAEVSEVLRRPGYNLGELPIVDVYVARETARRGNRDEALPLMFAAMDQLVRQGQLLQWGIPATGVLVETLLDRGTESDVAEAEAAVERLATAPADEALAIRDIWLLRLRALLARAHSNESAYRDYRDRYRDMATSLGFEGHMKWAEAMP